MLRARGLGGRATALEAPLELRFVDLLLIIIATLMFVAVVLTVINFQLPPGEVSVIPRITTASAPAAIQGRRYELTLAVTGGDGSYAWRLRGGKLPDGLSMRSDGVVRGIPGVPDRTQATVEVVDGQRRASQRDLVFEVRPAGAGEKPKPVPIRVASDRIVLPNAVGGNAYRYQFKADAGTPPYLWRVASGRLPDGLELAGEGDLIGNAAESGTSDFAVIATDAAGGSVTQAVRLAVVPPPAAVWQRVLATVLRVVTVYGRFLVVLWLLGVIFGRPQDMGSPGVLRRIKARLQGR